MNANHPTLTASRRAFLAGALVAPILAGCGGAREGVVVYAAQDRVFAEPLLEAFTRDTGVRVRPVYDNEATKTTGLAQRLMLERDRPRAQVWWSNEELRTRQLAAAGVLAPEIRTFGERRRVWVCPPGTAPASARPATLLTLPDLPPSRRLALAYPLFGTTAVHFLVLRDRWGEGPWLDWCRRLAARRPLLLDGNSLVVRAVASGQVDLGLTDSDDVRFARREGMTLEMEVLAGADGLAVANAVARVSGTTGDPDGARLAEWLLSPEVRRRLQDSGALDPDGASPAADPVRWEPVLAGLETGLRQLREIFLR